MRQRHADENAVKPATQRDGDCLCLCLCLCLGRRGETVASYRNRELDRRMRVVPLELEVVDRVVE